ncbi:MAG: hypothetical protein QM755_02855 [Luteolibacter sp.]
MLRHVSALLLALALVSCDKGEDSVATLKKDPHPGLVEGAPTENYLLAIQAEWWQRNYLADHEAILGSDPELFRQFVKKGVTLEEFSEETEKARQDLRDAEKATAKAREAFEKSNPPPSMPGRIAKYTADLAQAFDSFQSLKRELLKDHAAYYERYDELKRREERWGKLSWLKVDSI